MVSHFELEGVAGELQGWYFLHRDPQQPRKSVRLYFHVFASRYRNAHSAASISKSVAFQKHAVAFRHLDMRVGCTDVLKGLSFRDHAVNPRDVNAFQRHSAVKRACMYSQFSAVRDLEFCRVRWNDSFQQFNILDRRSKRINKYDSNKRPVCG